MHKSLTPLSILFAAALNGLFAYLVFARGMDHLYREDDLFETLQASFLFLGGLTFLLAMFLADKQYRVLLLSGVLLCLSFVLREIDVEQYRLPQVLASVGSGMGRNLVLLFAWLAILAWISTHFKPQFRAFWTCLWARPGIFLMAGGAFIVAGGVLDSELFSVHRHAFYEELAELDGCFLILQAGLACCWSLREHGVRRPSG